MSNRLPQPGCAPTKAEALRVFRIQPGTHEHARMVSPAYGGLFSHWTGRGSVYCDPDGCQASVHGRGQIWKGYAHAEIYSRAIKAWIPVVLEITEHLELDLRGQFARGQVWRLTRLPENKKKREPVTGLLVETLDAAALPPAIDVRPVLLTIYHVQRVSLDVRNPLPPRIMVQPSAGEPPPGEGSRADVKGPTYEDELDRIRRKAAENPKYARNGTGH